MENMKIYKFIFFVIILSILTILIFRENDQEIKPGIINFDINISNPQQIQNSLNNFQNTGMGINNFHGANSALHGASGSFINFKDF